MGKYGPLMNIGHGNASNILYKYNYMYIYIYIYIHI